MDENSAGWVKEKRWGDDLSVSVDQFVAMAEARKIDPTAFAVPTAAEAADPLMPENLLDTVSKLSGPGFAKLRSSLGSQFGIRLQSTGDAANSGSVEAPLTRIIMQTLGASPEHPYLVTFEQYILDLFTGPGQFDLVERDMSDVADGESQETIATKSGFIDETSPFTKVITVDKVYSVIFVPGNTGDGIYSIGVRALYPFQEEQQ